MDLVKRICKERDQGDEAKNTYARTKNIIKERSCITSPLNLIAETQNCSRGVPVGTEATCA